MKLAMIGLGQAGGRVLDHFLAYDAEYGTNVVHGAIAINTAHADLRGLDLVPDDHRFLIGQDRVKGQGVGADNELAAEIAAEDVEELQHAIDAIPAHEIDAFLILAGLGGGTGSGALPVVARQLKHIHTEPVYGLAILPGSDEGRIYTLNAARSLQTAVRELDNLLIFDNDAWRETGESVGGGHAAINRELVTRFGLIFAAGEVEPGQRVAESVVDASEIINTLAEPGLSTVGYAIDTAIGADDSSSGLLARFSDDDSPTVDPVDATNRITSLVRQAALGRLSMPASVDGVERVLLVVAGPPALLNRKGIERGRSWLEDETGSMEIRAGDFPWSRPEVAVGIVFAGVRDVPRIEQLNANAVEAKRAIDERQAAHDDNLSDLLSGGEGLELF